MKAAEISAKGEDEMKCICTRCGQQLESSELCFDFSEQFTESLMQFSNSRALPEFQNECEALKNHWKNRHFGASMLSEAELIWMTPHLQVKGTGVSEGTLSVDKAYWVRHVQEEIELTEEATLRELRMLKRIVDGDALEQTSYALQLEVRYYRNGEGAIQMDAVGLMTGESWKQLNIRYCPACGGAMSYWAGRFREIVLTVMGGPRVSKSSALAACASYFIDNGNQCGIKWEGADIDSDWSNFKKNCLDRYRRNEKVEPTNIVSAAIPRFSAKISIRGQKPLVLTVVDLPGEYDAGNGEMTLNNEVYKQYEEIYRNVDFVWYCTDDVQLEQKMDVAAIGEEGDLLRKTRGYDTGKELISTTKRVRKLELFSTLFDDPPVAFLLGKSDCIWRESQQQEFYRSGYRLGDESDWIEMRGGEPPAIDGTNYYAKVMELRDYLYRKNSDLIEGFEATFPAHTYIATSNYGHGFDTNGEGKELSPFQTEIPLLWTLAVQGYLPVREGKQDYHASEDKKTWENLCMTGDSKEGYSPHSKSSFLRWLLGLFGNR